MGLRTVSRRVYRMKLRMIGLQCRFDPRTWFVWRRGDLDDRVNRLWPISGLLIR